MTTQEVKEILEAVGIAKRRFKAQQEIASDLRATLSGGKRASLGGSFCERNGSNSVEKSLCRLVDKETYTDKLREEYITAHTRAMRLINTLTEPAEGEVLIRRYIKEERWEHIADEMNYTERHIRRIHDRALKKLQNSKDVLECPLLSVI